MSRNLGGKGKYRRDIYGFGKEVPPATTSSASRTSAGTSRTSASSSSVSNTTGSTRNVRDVDIDSMSAPGRSALSAILGGAQDSLVTQKDAASGANITGMEELLAFLDPTTAASRASGRVAELGRGLREGILPKIFSQAEGQGTGINALAQLLGQDAAIRTGEAQSRAEEEAINSAVSSQLQGRSTLNTLTSGTSGQSQRILEALGLDKGSMQRGTTVDTGTSSSTTNTTGTENSTTNTTGTDNSTTKTTDPLAWARFNQEGMNRSANRGDKVLAAFLAAGGNANALGQRRTVRNYGAAESASKLLQSIGRII